VSAPPAKVVVGEDTNNGSDSMLLSGRIVSAPDKRNPFYWGRMQYAPDYSVVGGENSIQRQADFG